MFTFVDQTKVKESQFSQSSNLEKADVVRNLSSYLIIRYVPVISKGMSPQYTHMLEV